MLLNSAPTPADLSRDLKADLHWLSFEAGTEDGPAVGRFIQRALLVIPAAIRRALAAEAEVQRLQRLIVLGRARGLLG